MTPDLVRMHPAFCSYALKKQQKLDLFMKKKLNLDGSEGLRRREWMAKEGTPPPPCKWNQEVGDPLKEMCGRKKDVVSWGRVVHLTG